MLLLEIAAQGIRGVQPAGGRITLRPGYNVVAADGSALRRLVEALLDPSPGDAEALPRSAGGSGSPTARAGVTLVGPDQRTWRVLRDFGRGAQLHVFDPERRAFTLASQALHEIGERLRAAAGSPSRALLACASLAAAELPSRARRAAGAAPAPASRPAPTSADAARLAHLTSELDRSRAVERLQAQVDALQGRLSDADAALRTGAELEASLASAQESLRQLAPVVEVAARLGNPETKLRAFERAGVRRDEALAKAAGERAELDGAAPRPLALWRDPLFLGGLGAGTAAVAGAVAGGGSARYLALLDVPAFGVAAWAALRFVTSLEALERQERRRRRVDEWERKALEQHARDSAEIRAAMEALEIGAPEDLGELLARLAAAQRSADAATRDLEAWRASPETRAAQVERAAIERELRGAEAALAEQAGGFVRDARSVEMEIARLGAEQRPPTAPPACAAAVGGEGGSPDAPALGPAEWVERAAAELAEDRAALAQALEPRAAQLAAALSGQRLAGLQIDSRGAVLASTGGRALGWDRLPPGDRDLCHLALKLALAERVLSTRRTVALADDAFAALPESARRVAARWLKQAARAGQVLHATGDPVFREAADHVA